MKNWLVLAALAVLSGCVSQVPFKRPMQETYRPAVKDMQVYTYAAKEGVGVQYFLQDSSAAGAPYGLLGVLVASAMDGMMNAGPREQSAKLANQLATGFDLLGTERELQQSLQAELGKVEWLNIQPEIKHAEAEQRLEADKFAEPAAMLVNLSYSMSPDLSHLILRSDVRVFSQTVQYQGLNPKEIEALADADRDRQYAIERNAKLAEAKASKDKQTKAKAKGEKPVDVPVDQRGQIYRNMLSYTSDALPVETRSQEDVEAKLAEIRARYTDANGKLTKNRDEIVKMNREIKAAKEPENPAQIAERRAAKWTADNGALLKQTLAAGIQELSRLIARDLQDQQVPQFDAKTADTVETSADGSRRLVKKASGWVAGQYVSEPTVVQFQMWNAIAHGDAAAAASGDE